MASFSTTSIPPVDNMSSLDLFFTKTNLPKISIKLASTNYLFWKAQIVHVLQGHGLLEYGTNEVPCPPTSILSENGAWNPNSVAATWLHLDQLILEWINSSLSDINHSQVINCKMKGDAWEALKTLYDQHTRNRAQQMRGELQALTKGSSCMEEYLYKAKALVLSLCGAKKSMEDEDFIICLLRGLGPEFDLIVVVINARDTFPPLENVINKMTSASPHPVALQILLSPLIPLIPMVLNHVVLQQSRARGLIFLDMVSTIVPVGVASLMTGLLLDVANSLKLVVAVVVALLVMDKSHITYFRSSGPDHETNNCCASNEEMDQY